MFPLVNGVTEDLIPASTVDYDPDDDENNNYYDET